MDWTPIAISLGAVLGALSRYYCSLFWLQRLGNRFPYGTLFVNLTGALAIGAGAAAISTFRLALPWQQFFLVGFLGAYTTFSTYILDAVKLHRSQQRLRALLYAFGSAVLGLACAELGLWLGQFWE
ncbi:MAG: fluoride efflux transporter CrcB [Cyanobacteria bacterium P01_D01_bin.71]